MSYRITEADRKHIFTIDDLTFTIEQEPNSDRFRLVFTDKDQLDIKVGLPHYRLIYNRNTNELGYGVLDPESNKEVWMGNVVKVGWDDELRPVFDGSRTYEDLSGEEQVVKYLTAIQRWRLNDKETDNVAIHELKDEIDVTHLSYLEVLGKTELYDDLIVHGITEFKGATTFTTSGFTSVNISQNLTVGGQTSLANTQVTGTFKVIGDSDLTGDLTVDGDTTLNGNVNINDELRYEPNADENKDGRITIGADVVGNYAQFENIHVTGRLWVNDEKDGDEAATEIENLTVDNLITTKDLTVQEKVTLQQELTLTEDLIMDNATIRGSIVGERADFDEGEIKEFTSDDITVNNSLVIDGNTGLLELSSGAKLRGEDAEFIGTVEVNGTLQTDEVKTDRIITAGLALRDTDDELSDLTLSKLNADEIDVNANVSIGGDLTVADVTSNKIVAKEIEIEEKLTTEHIDISGKFTMTEGGEIDAEKCDITIKDVTASNVKVNDLLEVKRIKISDSPDLVIDENELAAENGRFTENLIAEKTATIKNLTVTDSLTLFDEVEFKDPAGLDDDRFYRTNFKKSEGIHWTDEQEYILPQQVIFDVNVDGITNFDLWSTVFLPSPYTENNIVHELAEWDSSHGNIINIPTDIAGLRAADLLGYGKGSYRLRSKNNKWLKRVTLNYFRNYTIDIRNKLEAGGESSTHPLICYNYVTSGTINLNEVFERVCFMDNSNVSSITDVIKWKLLTKKGATLDILGGNIYNLIVADSAEEGDIITIVAIDENRGDKIGKTDFRKVINLIYTEDLSATINDQYLN